MSRILVCNPVHPETEVVKEAVAALRKGLPIVLPTETQYGLAIRADLDDAPEIIGRLKQRDPEQIPALFARDMTMVEQFCIIPPAAAGLAERYLPGPLTLILPPREGRQKVSAGFISEDGIGIRISSSPVVAAVMDLMDVPITATSANISGEMTPPTIDKIARTLGESVALYLDGGTCRGIVPSTVVKIDDNVRILRHGMIPGKDIFRFLAEENIHG